MDRACGMYGGEDRGIQGFDGNTRWKEPLGDLSVDGSIILKWIFKM